MSEALGTVVLGKAGFAGERSGVTVWNHPAKEPAGELWAPLAENWQLLQGSAGRLPQTDYEWCEAASQMLHYPSDLRLVTLADDRRIAALAPLVRQQIRGVDHLTLMSQDMLHEPMDFLYRSPEALHELVRGVLRMRHPLVLDRVDAGSELVKVMQSGRLPWHISRCTTYPGCPIIHLDDKWKNPEECLSSRRRQDFRRGLRKAEQVGKVRTTILTPTIEQLPGLLDTAFQIEAASWKGIKRTALQEDPFRGGFFRRYAELAAGRGVLRMAFLYLDERPVAMQFAVETHRALWLLKIGYDQQFAACSPGQILMRETIAYAAGRGLERFEFLGSIAPWTEAWTKDHRECVSLLAYPMGVRSLAALSQKSALAARGRAGRFCEMIRTRWSVARAKPAAGPAEVRSGSDAESEALSPPTSSSKDRPA